jgi:hypothetical protein
MWNNTDSGICFQAFTAVSVKIVVFCVVTPCSVVSVKQHFEKHAASIFRFEVGAVGMWSAYMGKVQGGGHSDPHEGKSQLNWAALSSIPQLFLFYFSQTLSLFIKSSNIRLNHLVLSLPVGLFPLDFNSNALLGILVISLFFV